MQNNITTTANHDLQRFATVVMLLSSAYFGVQLACCVMSLATYARIWQVEVLLKIPCVGLHQAGREKLLLYNAVTPI